MSWLTIIGCGLLIWGLSSAAALGWLFWLSVKHEREDERDSDE